MLIGFKLILFCFSFDSVFNSLLNSYTTLDVYVVLLYANSATTSSSTSCA